MQKFTRAPIDEIKNPIKGGFHMVYKNAWWNVDKDGNAFFYKKSPQCNANREVALRIRTHPDMVDTVQIEAAIFPINIQDY